MAILALSIYVLGVLLAEALFKFSFEQVRVLSIIDNIICAVFIGDFFYQLIRAKNKLGYLKWGWIDLVSSVPNFPILRIGRFARILRILKVLRGVRSMKHLLAFAYEKKASSALIATSLMSFIILIFSSVAILNVEITPEANIKNASDALWWGVATMTTVGYGDRYPVTTEGRIIAAMLMVTGVSLFGVLTGYITAFFMGPGEKRIEAEEKKIEKVDISILDELKEIKETLRKMEGKVAKE